MERSIFLAGSPTTLKRASIMAGLVLVAAYSVSSAQQPPRAHTADQTWTNATMKENVLSAEASQAFLAAAPDQNPKEARQAIFDVIAVYGEGVATPEGVKGLTAKALNKLWATRVGARSAAQVSQLTDETQIQFALIQIQQNQRIIGLLEELVKRPR
ncbi:MAG: hypothetical protein HYV93_19680 [Candidatus Rokubacteria bacterium]|nr:hypothetical protein [Candidatus Rokubacteria bacterium]